MTHPADPSPRPPCAAVWEDDLHAQSSGPVRWLWHGYLAPGNITLLTSQWKSGKTTLLSVLLRRLRTGGTLAGREVRPAKAVVVSEEPYSLWEERSRRLPFGSQVCWMCQPFRRKPTPDEWEDLIDHLLALHREHTLELVALDSLAYFLPGRGENDAGAMLEALMPLRRLTAAGLAVWPLHHPRKGKIVPGQAARGSGALAAFVDILMEIDWYGHPDDGDRRRRLRTFSRHPQTPPRLVIELNADGTDYVSHGDFQEDNFADTWRRLEAVLQRAGRKLTRRALLRAWPTGGTPPTEHALWRWLDRGVHKGRLLRDGTGRKNDPYRYWLPSQEEAWQQDPLYQLEKDDRELRRQIARLESSFAPPAD